MRARGLPLVLLVAAAISACGSDDEPPAGDVPKRACTEIGCLSGITVTLGELPMRAHRVRACAAGVCRTVEVGRRDRLFIPLAPDRSEERVGLRATVLAEDGERLDRFRAMVRLRRTRPNGPGCPPVCVTGEARLDGRAD